MAEYYHLESVEPLPEILLELFSRKREAFFAIIQAPVSGYIKSIMPTIDQMTVFYYHQKDEQQNDQYYCAFYPGAWSTENIPHVTVESIAAYVSEQNLPTLCLSRAIVLSTVCIPKPWGQEIWYTGIEERGVSSVLASNGETLPLPWLLQFAEPWIGITYSTGQPPILLKILDPHPEPVYGDLYFELHEKKQEVYVVTSVDEKAWPNGVGAIRMGFDQRKVVQAASQQTFKEQFLTAVQEYEAIRRTIDSFIDTLRMRDGVGLQQPVDIEQQKRWDAEVPEHWKQEEIRKRQTMNAFSTLVPLQVGDVVKVPRYIPHALQHGVRVVEFQTPVYERCIVSFAQKVLTQDHWDTDYAVNRMALETPEAKAFVKTTPAEGVLKEKIVEFDDFIVERVSIEAKSCWVLPASDTYQLVMVVKGNILSDGAIFSNEESFLLLAKKETCVENTSFKTATFLLAKPIIR